MPKKKSEKQIQNILDYYHERIASGSKRAPSETAKKYHITRQTVYNYLKKEQKEDSSESPPKESKPTKTKKDTTDTYTEIVAEKKIDEQFNEEHWNAIKSPRTENLIRFLEEKYPKKAKELIEANFRKGLELTFKELEVGVPTKDIEDLREGRGLNELLSDSRKPPTIDDGIIQERKEQAYKYAQMNNMWTGEQLERSKEALEISTFQTNNEQKFFDGEMMSFLKEYLNVQAVLGELSPKQQLYLKQKFMMEKALFIFPLIGEILYTNSGGYQEPELTEEEVGRWFNKQPRKKREYFLKEIENIKVR